MKGSIDDGAADGWDRGERKDLACCTSYFPYTDNRARIYSTLQTITRQRIGLGWGRACVRSRDAQRRRATLYKTRPGLTAIFYVVVRHRMGYSQPETRSQHAAQPDKMPSNNTARSMTRYYPSSATDVGDLSEGQQRLKIARHSACQGGPSASSSSRAQSVDCDCHGLRPPSGLRVKSLSIKTNSAASLDAGQWGWDTCRCGHSLESHGLVDDNEGEDEFRRRAKVAVRMDELLEDQHRLLDFDYEDEDLTSLRKQLSPSGPASSTPRLLRNGLNGLKRKSRSPAESTRLSSVEPSIHSREGSVSLDSPSGKRRRMQSRSQTASRAATPSKALEGQGHGKMPKRSQKGLPDDKELSEVAKANEEANDETGKPEVQVEQTDKDVERVTKGISMDTEAIASKTTDTADDLDESAPPIRERPAVIEERSGLIQFRVVTNDGKPDSMIILTGLKNIFQRQLPKMPREYITRLVMDRNHWSMAIVKRGLQVVGGITYRPFNNRRFAEIVFCAITSTEQVKGYGLHLMNHLKDHVKVSSDVMHFLTYADNYAIGYFKKQGFSKEISLDRSVWVGYIKDYEGGTLMQCSMLPRVEYLKAQELLASQRQLILNKIRSISKSHIVYPGLDVFRNPTPKNEEKANSDDPSAHFKIDPSEVPGLKESAWTVEMDELSRRPRRGPHHNLMRHILVEMGNHQAAWPFANPVNAQEVPDYYEVIKEPMDMSTMETKLENNQYGTIDDMMYDAQLSEFGLPGCRRSGTLKC